MDAHFYRAAFLAATFASLGASYRTTNFIVSAPTPQLAQEIGDKAEADRRQLAVDWLGSELPPWGDPCPITAQVSPQLGAGGATSFMFDNGRPFGWRMSIQGSRERVLDSVLPHEITHTIFATHFGRPLPRWADEGGCTTVEHDAEKEKMHRNLYLFLTTGRGIAFNQMFAMREYPADVLPLYAQGYSLARYLIAQGGRRKYVAFVGDGMNWNNWTVAVKQHYGFESLSDLQVTWLDWVRQGSPALTPDAPGASPTMLASAQSAAGAGIKNASGVIYRGQSEDPPLAQIEGSAKSIPWNGTQAQNPLMPAANPDAATFAQSEPPPAPSNGGSWYLRQGREAASAAPIAAAVPVQVAPPASVATRTTNGPTFRAPAAPGVTRSVAENSLEPVSPAGTTEMSTARPQPPESSRQIIMEWSRPGPGNWSAAPAAPLENVQTPSYGAPLSGGGTVWR